MAMEQVNLQELQRLNDAITVTFDAIRRVAPQIQALQQMAQMQLPFVGGYGMNVQNPWGQQQAYGGGGQQHLGPLVHVLAQQIAQQLSQPWGQQQYGGLGQQQYGIGQQPYGGIGQSFGQNPFGAQSNTMPFQQFGQRLF